MRENRLLRALTPAQVRRLGLEPVTFKRDEIVHRTDEPLNDFFLLSTGLVSLVRPLPDGERVGVWSFDGTLIGGQTVFQVREPTYDAVMRTDATGWRVSREALAAAMDADPKLRQIILAWVHYMDTAIAISVGCQIAHSVEQRLCRWLLSVRLSTRSNRIELSLPEIAVVLPATRTQVYNRARLLQAAGGIRIARQITVITNAAVLESHTCGCFAAVARAYNEAIPNP